MSIRRTIPLRQRIFLGCEGKSEEGYGHFLQRLAVASKLKTHIQVRRLQPSAGDPRFLAKRAIQLVQEQEKGDRRRFHYKALILDADRLDELPDRGDSVFRLLEQEGFLAIWQRPDHEGLLLRHFPGHERDDPPQGASMNALHKAWPEYHKNMDAMALAKQFSLEDVQRVAKVLPELQDLLEAIGLA